MLLVGDPASSIAFLLLVKLSNSTVQSYCPVPLSDTDREVAGAATFTFSDALLEPVLVGLNVTLIVQLPRTARLAGQAFVCAKSPALVPVIPMLLMVNGALPVLDSVTV